MTTHAVAIQIDRECVTRVATIFDRVSGVDLREPSGAVAHEQPVGASRKVKVGMLRRNGAVQADGNWIGRAAACTHSVRIEVGRGGVVAAKRVEGTSPSPSGYLGPSEAPAAVADEKLCSPGRVDQHVAAEMARKQCNHPAQKTDLWKTGRSSPS